MNIFIAGKVAFLPIFASKMWKQISATFLATPNPKKVSSQKNRRKNENQTIML
jgi:hypothetical protein